MICRGVAYYEASCTCHTIEVLSARHYQEDETNGEAIIAISQCRLNTCRVADSGNEVWAHVVLHCKLLLTSEQIFTSTVEMRIYFHKCWLIELRSLLFWKQRIRYDISGWNCLPLILCLFSDFGKGYNSCSHNSKAHFSPDIINITMGEIKTTKMNTYIHTYIQVNPIRLA